MSPSFTFSSFLFPFLNLESQILQNAANKLPKHECAVALNAPGKYDNGSAPILFANTTANAEFCIPVSIDMVRDVRSVNPKTLGTMYPAANPIMCVRRTESRIRVGMVMTPSVAAAPPIHIPELFATTPPQIKLTNTTLAKGVHLETHRHTPGIYSFNVTPKATGTKTTLAVAAHNAFPLTGTALPTIHFVNSGVTADARIVLQAVRRTLNATSAPAIRLTRLDAVPPGLHPTKTKPKNKCFPRCTKVWGSW